MALNSPAVAAPASTRDPTCDYPAQATAGGATVCEHTSAAVLDSVAEDRPTEQARRLDQVREVDRSKGEHWAGGAGKYRESGTFSVGGTKEVAYAVFNVLTDETTPGYRRVRATGAPLPEPALNVA